MIVALYPSGPKGAFNGALTAIRLLRLLKVRCVLCAVLGSCLCSALSQSVVSLQLGALTAIRLLRLLKV